MTNDPGLIITGNTLIEDLPQSVSTTHSPSPALRLLVRGGERVLQQRHTTIRYLVGKPVDVTAEWVDVPTVEDDTSSLVSADLPYDGDGFVREDDPRVEEHFDHGWMPIATAPKDFTEILVGWWHYPNPERPESYLDEYGYQDLDPKTALNQPRWVVCLSSYEDYGWRRGFNSMKGAHMATHWKPLPGPALPARKNVWGASPSANERREGAD